MLNEILRQTGNEIKAFLFDADGVIVDTEKTYAEFWGGIARKYIPERTRFAYEIKGMTLEKILLAFPEDKRKEIEEATHEFESSMDYPFFPGATELLNYLRKDFKLALVTSSDEIKMKRLYHQHPDFPDMFDTILTAESITNPKPAPDCYLSAAERVGASIKECIIVEDGINGLKSAKSSGAFVIGLATTHPKEMVAPYCNIVFDDIREILA